VVLLAQVASNFVQLLIGVLSFSPIIIFPFAPSFPLFLYQLVNIIPLVTGISVISYWFNGAKGTS
jgi:hypothetical protein